MVFMWFRLVGRIVEKWEVIWIHINLNNNNTYRILHRLVFPLHSSIFIIGLLWWCDKALQMMFSTNFLWHYLHALSVLIFYGYWDYAFQRILYGTCCIIYMCWFLWTFRLCFCANFLGHNLHSSMCWFLWKLRLCFSANFLWHCLHWKWICYGSKIQYGRFVTLVTR